jgi:hypothetical protein
MVMLYDRYKNIKKDSGTLKRKAASLPYQAMQYAGNSSFPEMPAG